jgi:hypothetical protein
VNGDTITITQPVTSVSIASPTAINLTVSDGGVQVVSVGTPGPAGATPSSGDKTYALDFGVTSTLNVTHALGKYPAVTVLDSSGDQCEGDVYHLDINTLRVVFSAPFSGKLTCN